MSNKWLLAAAILASLFPQAASAAVVQATYEGIVTASSVCDADGNCSEAYAPAPVGSTLSYNLIYDDADPFVFYDGWVDVLGGREDPRFGFVDFGSSWALSPAPGTHWHQLRVIPLPFGPGDAWFSSAAWDAGDASVSKGLFGFMYGDDDAYVNFDVTSFSLAASDFDAANAKFLPYLPEPSTWLSLILGFGLIGATLRRRQLLVRPCVA